jgi:hypothetical protein
MRNFKLNLWEPYSLLTGYSAYKYKGGVYYLSFIEYRNGFQITSKINVINDNRLVISCKKKKYWANHYFDNEMD